MTTIQELFNAWAGERIAYIKETASDTTAQEIIDTYKLASEFAKIHSLTIPAYLQSEYESCYKWIEYFNKTLD